MVQSNRKHDATAALLSHNAINLMTTSISQQTMADGSAGVMSDGLQ